MPNSVIPVTSFKTENWLLHLVWCAVLLGEWKVTGSVPAVQNAFGVESELSANC